MNYYDAGLITERWAKGEVSDKDAAEAFAFMDAHERAEELAKRSALVRQRRDEANAWLAANLRPSMDAPCACGLRYGMHRVNDYLCPNQKWRPGNGEPQWLGESFKRKT